MDDRTKILDNISAVAARMLRAADREALEEHAPDHLEWLRALEMWIEKLYEHDDSRREREGGN